MGQAPPPLEWHPYYRDKPWLLDWLERRGEYAGLDHLKIPRPAPTPTFTMSPDDLYPMALGEPIILTRRKAWGPAPYVGRPFVYVWWVGTDQLGRHIAGESRIVYGDEWQP